jgi:hypothetical protein
MVDVAEFVVAMGEAAESVTAAHVAFKVFIGANHERDQGDCAGDFDPAIGHNLGLAPERQCEDHVAAPTRRLAISVPSGIERESSVRSSGRTDPYH